MQSNISALQGFPPNLCFCTLPQEWFVLLQWLPAKNFDACGVGESPASKKMQVGESPASNGAVHAGSFELEV